MNGSVQRSIPAEIYSGSRRMQRSTVALTISTAFFSKWDAPMQYLPTSTRNFNTKTPHPGWIFIGKDLLCNSFRIFDEKVVGNAHQLSMNTSQSSGNAALAFRKRGTKSSSKTTSSSNITAPFSAAGPAAAPSAAAL